MTDNPFFERWDTPFGIAPFGRIEAAHYVPAFERAMKENLAEIDAIATDPAKPTIANTLDAFERAGDALDRVSSVFWNLTGTDSTPDLQAIERDMAPALARHSTAIFMNAALFRRFDALHVSRDALGATPEQTRVIERIHLAFVRSGAGLDATGQLRMAQITERMAVLGTLFSQNVLKAESDFLLLLDGEDALAGLPDFLIASAARTATERGYEGQHAITLLRSSIEPFLTFSANRALRETAYKAWIARGATGSAFDNTGIIIEMVGLRAERARLLGYASFSDFKLADSMAKTPAAVERLLAAVWTPAVARAGRERDDLAVLAQGEGHNEPIEPWDWRYYSEKVRRSHHDLDEAQIKPYFTLEAMIAAAFYTANRLFGLTFDERSDVSAYHPEVRVWDVTDRDGRHVGLFLGDYYARASKRSGAWMSAFRSQRNLGEAVRPIIVNVMNFSKGGANESALLSFDDAHTLFHEFGHALHGLMSDVTYPWISGTSVARDFVELPSQLYEHWLDTPEILTRFARHATTNEPMPDALIERVLGARTFNQGFTTVEYASSALVDMAFHALENADGLDVDAFERETLARYGMPRAIGMRHRPTHFTHVFAGDGYAAGYYSYLWSEVLDADAFQAFREAGDVFDPATAQRLARDIYSAGGRKPPDEAYVAFRGRLPTIEPLLEKRGLVTA